MFSKKNSYNRLAFQITALNAGAIIIGFFIVILVLDILYSKKENALAKEKAELYWKVMVESSLLSIGSFESFYYRDLGTSERVYGLRIADQNNKTMYLNYPDSWNKYTLRASDFENQELILNREYRLKVFTGGKSYNTEIDVYSLYVRGYYIQILISIEERARFIKLVIEISSFIFFIVIFMSYFFANFIISRVLSPVNSINKIVEKIIARGDVGQRLEEMRSGEFDRLQSNFNIMLDVIEQHVKKLKQAVINIGHDIRTPLTRMRNQLEDLELELQKNTIIETDTYNNKIKTMIDLCVESIEDVKDLSKQILDLSEIESGAVIVPQEKTLIAQTLEPVIEMYEMLAEESKIRINKNLEKNLGVFIDPVRLKQLVGNLLDNALKFTPAYKNVDINVYHKSGVVYIEIIDEGVGIPEEDIPKIFDHSWKSNSKNNKKEHGYGFGLTIVESIVNAYRGTIKVESQLGKGTKFTVSFG